MTKPTPRFTVIWAVLGSLLMGTSACALDPVETDPVKAGERAAAMRQDCYARGGTWNEGARTCVGADARRSY